MEYSKEIHILRSFAIYNAKCHAIIIAVVVTSSYFMLVLLFPHMFARMFTPDKQLIDLLTDILPVFMGGIWLFGVQMTAQAFFVGTGQAGKSLFIASLRKIVILIPLALTLPEFFGVMGVFYSEPIADMISATVSGMLLLISLKHIKKQVPV